MNLSAFLLLSVPGFPLLLAMPLLHRFILRPEYLAILPAVVLLILPENRFVEMPWLLLDSGLGSGEETRLLLVMAVVLWVFAAFILNAHASRTGGCVGFDYSRTYFMLTMSGHLGAILANGLVGFFIFSTLMGYGFYGLMVEGGNHAVRKAGRIYICFIIAADLLLFEAALLAASVTDDMGFEAVRVAMADSSISGLYMSMVLIGFALKAGFWPLHYWLYSAFHSARPAVVMLLAGVPVAIALLGTLRWLPTGEIALPGPGLIMQSFGGVAIMYTMIAGLMRPQLKHLAANFTLVATGLFAIALGTGFTDPAVWKQYASLMFFFIVLLSIGAALLAIVIRCSDEAKPYEKSLDDTALWFERWPVPVIYWGRHMGFAVLPRLRNACLALIQSFWKVHYWQKTLQTGEHYLQRWFLAVTLLLLVGITVVLLLIN